MSTFRSTFSFDEFIDSLPDGIVLVDYGGRIRDVNEQIEDLFGYSKHELRGESIERLVPERHRDAHRRHRNEYFEQASQREMGSGLQLTGRRKDGTTFPVDVSLVPVGGPPTDDPSDLVVMAVVRDISDRIQRQQRLSVLDRILRHNIRQHLTLVQGNADSCSTVLADLRDATGSLEQRIDEKLLNQLREVETDAYSELVDLLEEIEDTADEAASRAEQITTAADELLSTAERARQLHELLESEQRDLRSIEIGSVIDAVLQTVGERYPNATLEVEDRTHQEMRQPYVYLEAIVEELVSNAVRHSDSTTPEVAVRAFHPDDGRIAIEVADRGPGIPDMEKQVLENQEEKPLMHSSGFGLWKVKWLVLQMDGRLSFEENEPIGTVVRVELPLRKGN